MDVHLDVPTARYAGRLEVLDGPTGRRVRSQAERARIAAESLIPGVQVAAVARKHGATRWQVYDWRRRLRQGQLALPESMAPMFAQLMVDDSSAPQRRMKIEIDAGAGGNLDRRHGDPNGGCPMEITPQRAKPLRYRFQRAARQLQRTQVL
ncbi:transposase [Mesorhizobium australicum]|uniref:Transposase n=1 Tax=Mesorhizobium australicum TaxID=536018 RepID=A0ACC6T6W1_9HYPH